LCRLSKAAPWEASYLRNVADMRHAPARVG
jgi:hypothetical protein